ncbi:laccase [Taiwanofungus camphoratus]|nr:laccase [Antrodia cinnamomea]
MVTLNFLSATALTVLSLWKGIHAQIGPIASLSISNRNIAPDGYNRAAVLAGGTFPGPLIRGNKGANFQINVINQLTNETMLKTTTVHWHGLFQRTTNWADGPAFVTQCPIASGDSFLYDFHVPNQAGTFWYHSHEGLQYCDGLRGPLVVYDPHDPHQDMYDFDNDDTIITLADWYHVAARYVPVPPVASSVLINGLGRDSTNSTSALSVITVVPGKRYRIRLVSMSCDPNFLFSIDGHNMTIIEADGENTQPLLVDSIQIFAAQRYSFILTATQPVNNYWIRAIADTQATPPGMAILRYVGAPHIDPNTNPVPSTNPLVESNLHPLIDPQAPGGASIDAPDVIPINLNFTFNGTNFFANGVEYVPPSIPVLLQILNGSYNAQDLLPPGSLYTLERNKTYQISMPALASADVAGPHPVHLHGHTFSVIRSAGNESYNFANPVRRDTVSIGGINGASDNVTIRFNVRNGFQAILLSAPSY